MMKNHHDHRHQHQDKNDNDNVSATSVSSPRTPQSSFTTPRYECDSSSTSDQKFCKWGHSTATERDDKRRSISRDDLDDFSSLDDDGEEIQYVCRLIDHIMDLLNSTNDKLSITSSPEVEDGIETSAKVIESRIARYTPSATGGGRTPRRFGGSKMVTDFIEAVIRMSKLNKTISELIPPESHSNNNSGALLNRTGVVLQKAIGFLEDELRALLGKANKVDAYCRFASFNRNENKEADFSLAKEPLSEEYYPGYSQEIIKKMSRIVSAMIMSGYETECCRIYAQTRITAFHEQLKKMDYDKFNAEEVWTMNWDCLELEIKRWINVVKSCAGIIFPGEKQLILQVFASFPSASSIIFKDFARKEIVRFLDFAVAVSKTQKGSEKLFRILDMYEALRDLVNELIAGDTYLEEEEYYCKEQVEPVRTEVAAVRDRLGETSVGIIFDLQNSIKTEATKSPVPGGCVHPVARYVMNYVKLLCDYKEIIEQILEYHQRWEQSPGTTPTNRISTSSISPQQQGTILNNTNIESDGESPHYSDTIPCSTPLFTKQMVITIEKLDSNLEMKSWMYRDNSLRSVFLMNNGRYILQKVKGSEEIHGVMGDNWCRRRATVVRHFHKNYQRETWIKLLNTLSHEGILMNSGKVNKPLLKERFKNFNTMFEEIHKTQSTWVVSDEQLQSELRISISAVIIPAYRSFLGRFKQYLESSKQLEKYIKYQPEDIETLIEGLFEGNSASMGRKRFS